MNSSNEDKGTQPDKFKLVNDHYEDIWAALSKGGDGGGQDGFYRVTRNGGSETWTRRPPGSRLTLRIEIDGEEVDRGEYVMPPSGLEVGFGLPLTNDPPVLNPDK